MDIEKRIKSIKPGTFFRVTYKSELPVKAEFKKQGVTVTKVTTTQARIGCQYNHIARVIQRRIENPPTRKVESHYVWEIPQKIAYNSNTGKRYATLTYAPKAKPRSSYIITRNGETVTTNTLDRNLIVDSYFRNSEPDVKYVALDNIITI